jgi:predicted secreted hydrolase
MKRTMITTFSIFILFFCWSCTSSDDDDCQDCETAVADDDADDDDDTDAQVCVTDELRCGEGDIPEKCENGEWIVQSLCPRLHYCNFGECVDTLIFFPDDEAPHRDMIEWWYWTGDVTDADGNMYGFELTFFYGARVLNIPAWMIHVGIVDESAGEHEGNVWYDFGQPDENPNELHLSSGTASVDRGEDYVYELVGDAGNYGYDFTLTDVKGPVYHGGLGAVRMSSRTADSFYYSRPRIDVEGILYKDGEPIEVTGEAWMDHQWGNFIPFSLIGWDWFSMRLSDNTEIMYFIFRGDEEDWSVVDMALGTYIDENGDQTILSEDEIIVEYYDIWESSVTDGVYPQNWNFRVPGLDLDVDITTGIADQEMPNFFWNYWEGMMNVEGTKGGQPVTGRGFVELSGYAGRPMFWQFFDVWDEKDFSF